MANNTFFRDGTRFEDRYVKFEELSPFITLPGVQPRSLWAWGGGAFGSSGLGNESNQSSPVQVGSLTDWATVSAGYRTTIAVKTNNTLWAWGDGFGGRLGLNNQVSRSSPVQIGSLAAWSTASSGQAHFLALRNDGSLWVWGFNTSGALGLNNAINRSSPTQIGSETDWQRIGAGGSASTAIKTDGTLWAWGAGNGGALGLNSVISHSSPTQVGSLTNWASVSSTGSGYTVHVMAIKTDGSLWSWGQNGYGQLGLNSVISHSSPVQVGSLTNWARVSAGYNTTMAIKTDGTLWAWGGGFVGAFYGGLGLNNTTYFSSPVQVGSLSNWAEISNGGITSFAIRAG